MNIWLKKIWRYFHCDWLQGKRIRDCKPKNLFYLKRRAAYSSLVNSPFLEILEVILKPQGMMEFKLFVMVEDWEVFVHDQSFTRKISSALLHCLIILMRNLFFPQIKLQPIQLNSEAPQQIKFALWSVQCKFVAIHYLLFLSSYVHSCINWCIQIIQTNQFLPQIKFKWVKVNQPAYREKASRLR